MNRRSLCTQGNILRSMLKFFEIAFPKSILLLLLLLLVLLLMPWQEGKGCQAQMNINVMNFGLGNKSHHVTDPSEDTRLLVLFFFSSNNNMTLGNLKTRRRIKVVEEGKGEEEVVEVGDYALRRWMKDGKNCRNPRTSN